MQTPSTVTSNDSAARAVAVATSGGRGTRTPKGLAARWISSSRESGDYRALRRVPLDVEINDAASGRITHWCDPPAAAATAGS